MIISKTPVRISVGGGGTDLPSFYSKFGSRFMSAAIDKYVYIVIQDRSFYNDFVIKYSQVERVRKIDQVKNELVRESLRLVGIKKPIEIVSFSDVGGMSGLGSSGSFTVGLLNALHAYKGDVVPAQQLAEEACYIAIDVLGQPSGKQDEYIAAFGGLTAFEIDEGGVVTVNKAVVNDDFTDELDRYLFMFYTGINRESKTVLGAQKKATENNDATIISNLRNVQELGDEISKALVTGNAMKFGELLHKHWLLKRKRSKTTNEKIDEWYKIARRNGALGGKIMGAGGGGFFLFYCEENGLKLIDAMTEAGLQFVPFSFEKRGSRVVLDL